jgi:hypothetical protein
LLLCELQENAQRSVALPQWKTFLPLQRGLCLRESLALACITSLLTLRDLQTTGLMLSKFGKAALEFGAVFLLVFSLVTGERECVG